MKINLREARKSKGLSMTYMAHKLGYKSVSGYANIEYGTTKASLENAVKIANILNMPLDELFFEEKLHISSKKTISIGGFKMKNLNIIVHDNRRVLTTNQLAESYSADSKIISNNFMRNHERYTEGKHFICLTGDDLKQFKANHQNDELPMNINKLYLWTEKGAWLHAKSLNTDKAWDAYELLVDEYYKVIDQTNKQDPIELALQTSLKNYQEIKSIKGDVEYLKDHMRIDGSQEFALNSQGKAKVFEVLGGYNSSAYNAVSRKAFGELWRDFKRHFQLPRYSELPKTKFEDAVYFISKWRPSTSLEIEIESYNKQGQLKLVK